MPPKKKPKGKPKGGESGGTTVGGMLAALGIADPTAAFEACVNFEDEFRVVKKAYLKIVLKEHPDKGGDRERFEAVQTAWETLSTMKAENKLGSLKLAKTFERSAAREHAHAAAHRPSSTPDWSFYAEAFKDSGLPLYKVERAKSGRSRCEMREKEATADKKAVKRRAHTVNIKLKQKKYYLEESAEDLYIFLVMIYLVNQLLKIVVSTLFLIVLL